MIFSASATHALSAMASLAGRGSAAPALGRDLAKQIGLPAPYLSKVLATLARSGVLIASRGAKGGYRLARPAGRIRLIDVVLPFEGRRARPGCLLRPGEPCRSSRACSAHDAWGDAQRSFTDFLEKKTVADIQRGAPGLPKKKRSRKVRRPATRAHRGRSPGRRGRAS